MRSDASTSVLPVRAEVSMPFFPFPESLVAMGPERKATEATGPVTEVAKATRRSARRISVSRILLTLTPRVTAWASPS